jgi:hypothetical protein
VVLLVLWMFGSTVIATTATTHNTNMSHIFLRFFCIQTISPFPYYDDISLYELLLETNTSFQKQSNLTMMPLKSFPIVNYEDYLTKMIKPDINVNNLMGTFSL